MPKKKKTSKKKRVSNKKEKKPSLPENDLKLEKALIDNFIALQKVMTNLSIKFDSLTSQISKLLDLFEISAKSLAEKDFNVNKENKENKKILDNLDKLMDQNKTIARGLTLMHESGVQSPGESPQQNSQPPQVAREMQPPRPFSLRDNMQEYQRSISSNSPIRNSGTRPIQEKNDSQNI